MNPAEAARLDTDLRQLLARTWAPKSCKVCGRLELRLAGQVDFNRVDLVPPPFPAAGIPVEYWQCESCGFAWAPAFDDWSEAHFARFIYNEDIVLVETPENAAARCANIAAILRVWFGDYPSTTRFLDYGCGPGLLVEAQRSAGFSADGYDRFNPCFAARPQGPFDVITCFEVMEHINAIDPTVDDMLSFLAPAGMLVLGTFLAARPMAGDWWYCSPRAGHISFWTFPALSMVFNKRKLNVASDGKMFSFVFPDEAKSRVMKIFAP